MGERDFLFSNTKEIKPFSCQTRRKKIKNENRERFAHYSREKFGRDWEEKHDRRGDFNF